MRITPLAGAGLGTAALCLAAGLPCVAAAAGAEPSVVHSGTTSTTLLQPPDTSCYAQLDDDVGVGVSSQKTERALAQYRDRGADDFVLDRSCNAASVDVAGVYYGGSEPLLNAQVVFYRDDGGTPGRVIARRIVPAAKVGGDGLGDLHVPFRALVALRPGHYWLGFRVRMDMSAGANWGWELNSTQRTDPAMWKNRGQGWGVGCPTYTVMTQCVGAYGPDFAFAVNADG